MWQERRECQARLSGSILPCGASNLFHGKFDGWSLAAWLVCGRSVDWGKVHYDSTGA